MTGIDGTVSAITSIVTAVTTGIIMMSLNRRAKKEDIREENRSHKEYLILNNINAISGVVGKIAVCVKNNKVNGDMTEALDYQKKQMHDLEEFLVEMASKKQ